LISRNIHEEQAMFALHAVPQQVEVFRVLVLILAAAGLVFWRVAFKIIVSIVIIFIALGAVAFALGFLGGMLHFIG
jgi:hypothetical protein